MEFSTRIIHEDNIKDGSGAVMSPIILSTTFERGEDGINYPGGYFYSRYDNPNRNALENKLAKMENGATCVSFASGLAAATNVFQSLKSGDHIIIPDDTYFSIRSILDQMFAAFGIRYTLVDMTDLAGVEKAIQPNTVLIWMETPSNPSLKITDIEAIVRIAKKHNCFTVADNTWATPFYTKPTDLGVDITLHSTTKYLGGHSDILGGALIFKNADERYERIRAFQKLGGAVPSPYDCWLLCRSLTTFVARMPIHSNNAMQLASYLEAHPKIERVLYPGLTSHPQHPIAVKQMQNGYGGMLSILVKGDRSSALKLADALNLFTHATSLGGVESLIEHRKSIEGEASPTADNLLRISVGIEDIKDLVEDFKQALEKI
ncbi:aminotransferase class I/II-fold pyridoxal phosphate-dependent enzyme [Lacibacter luteus]|uniref:Aminotransferase class I/II-fold pyridoxal phosphate-dependent enzyme n=1 Tax=Lacibacter luteus TaxID=2508719 RepID=A0A4Q1CPH1_9BACT|nr:PLP-dependent aspartate aminotransferase family protein [Lacibacter luteus]RXK62794.1 aminotransferase class I/II-fold pyridoxal phosphate-dependent enzyme [Lacibacter luteus]